MKIGIIGKGMVGGTMADGLTQIGHTVICYDPLKGLYNLDALLDATCIFVCVPTPTINNKCDTSIVEEVVSHLSQRNYEGVVAIKSTVIPGTTERLAKLFSNLTICFVPEFLKEKSALSDFIDHHDVLIVGTDDEAVCFR